MIKLPSKNYSNSITFCIVTLLPSCSLHGSSNDMVCEHSSIKTAPKLENVIFEHEYDNIEIVFDRKNMISYSRSKGSIEEDSHFGQSIVNCGNKEFYCLDGDLSVSIPKNITKISWTYNKYNCSIKSNNNLYKIVQCEDFNKSRLTLISFEKNGNIVSFRVSGGNFDSTYNIKNGVEISICNYGGIP